MMLASDLAYSYCALHMLVKVVLSVKLGQPVLAIKSSQTRKYDFRKNNAKHINLNIMAEIGIPWTR